MDVDYAEVDSQGEGRNKTGSDYKSGCQMRLPVNSKPTGELDAKRCLVEQ